MTTRVRSNTLKEEIVNYREVLAYFNDCLKPDDPFRIQQFDSRFQKVLNLGNGRFGVIVKFLDTEKNQFVAGKIVNVQLFNNWLQTLAKIKIRVDNFLADYKQIASLSYKNDRIANFLGIASDSEKIVILTEFTEKGSVKDFLKEEGLSEVQAIKYFYQAAEGLEFLHAQNPPIIHRDIKAANLLLTAADNVKLANFGLVRELTVGGVGLAVASQEITEDFRFTLLYMAPEVLISEKGPADPKSYGKSSDLWALGCTLIEMLTRFPPYFEFFVMQPEPNENDNFHNRFIERAKGKNPLPYNSVSLVPSSSFPVQFLVNKIFDKKKETRISANGLTRFLELVNNDSAFDQEYLESQFTRAVELSFETRPSTAQEKRNRFKSLKQISIQSFARIRSSTRKTETVVEEEKPEKTLDLIEEGRSITRQTRKRKRHKKTFPQNCWFCLTYCIFRLCCFTGYLCKSVSYVVMLVFVGLGTLASFFCLAFGVVVLIRTLVSSFCECDVDTPTAVIISGIFLILLFALFFSCCMVALGEYKFRVANKSLHKSRFFVPRPSKDVKFFGIQVIKGKRDSIEFDIPVGVEKSDLEKFYNPEPSLKEVIDENNGENRRATTIKEEPSRKLANVGIPARELQDLYPDQSSVKI